jgi:uncharacterized membrane protein
VTQSRTDLFVKNHQEEIMETVKKSIDVEAPVRTVYNQWTQFEEFPRFMEGVKRVTQLDDQRLHWVAEIAGKEKEWDAKITEQIPDQRIAWSSEAGEFTAGIVSFEPVGSNRTKVTLEMAYDPQGAMENLADAIGIVSRRIEKDLERFKEFIENRGRETGGWRGTIQEQGR